jgi:predicted alpha/beta superfamily hydrolase
MVTPVRIAASVQEQPDAPAANVGADHAGMIDPVIPGATARDMRSRSGDYRILVWQPTPELATGPLPVLYLLDGNVTFPIAAAAVAAQSRRPEITGVQPALVVGIGYPNATWLDPDRRTFDYTLPLAEALLPPRPDDRPWPPTGGADQFLDFLQHEVQPWIEREFDVDPARRALFGHSFGGLLVLHALFTRAALFNSYIAASPSIWFGGDGLRTEMNRFMAAPGDRGQRDLMITVGSLEQSGGSPDQSERSGHQAWLKRNRMVDNARELAATLSVMAPSALRVCFNQFDDENHASVVPAAISRTLRFALAGKR